MLCPPWFFHPAKSWIENWKRAGSKSYGERAKDKVRETLRTHHPEPIPDATMKELRAILAAADKREAAKAR